MTKAKKLLSPALFILASIFLFNPNVNLLDLLPDFIGYILILRALAGIEGLVPHFDTACRIHIVNLLNHQEHHHKPNGQHRIFHKDQKCTQHTAGPRTYDGDKCGDGNHNRNQRNIWHTEAV